MSRELSDELKWEEDMDLKTCETYNPLISAHLAMLLDESSAVT